MDSSSKHNLFPYKHDGNRQKNLHPYNAPVNHNVLNEAKALNIAQTMLGNFCHSAKDKELHMEHIGNDACVVVGFNNMVRIYQHLVLFHNPTITLTNHKTT
jgi:hypothetical protein